MKVWCRRIDLFEPSNKTRTLSSAVLNFSTPTVPSNVCFPGTCDRPISLRRIRSPTWNWCALPPPSRYRGCMVFWTAAAARWTAAGSPLLAAMMDISQLTGDRACLVSWIAIESTPAQPSRFRISARTIAINSLLDKIDVGILIHLAAAADIIGRPAGGPILQTLRRAEASDLGAPLRGLSCRVRLHWNMIVELGVNRRPGEGIPVSGSSRNSETMDVDEVHCDPYETAQRRLSRGCLLRRNSRSLK